MESYTWVFAFAVVFTFLAAFGIGANDVANAFATSVGARSLTVKQAVLAGAIFEFCGAFFMGSHVAKTIRKGITDLDVFQKSENDAELLMFGMMCVCFSTMCWLAIATYWSLPVSTTHTCVGSVMGMAIAAKGWDAVNWNVVSKIVLSWFFSPILSGVCAVILNQFIIHVIMKSNNPSGRTVLFYPILVAFCVIIVVFYTIYKGTPQLGLKKTPLGVACGVAFGIGIFFGLLTYAFASPILRERMEKVDEEAKDVEMSRKNDGGAEVEASYDDYTKENGTKKTTSFRDSFKSAMDTVMPNVEERFQENASQKVLDMHEAAIDYDPKAELGFSYLQVFSACFDAFAHGANDVANSIGPMAAVYAIWDTAEVSKKVEMPLWILGLGGVGIVIGLALYGYNIMQAIGFELTKLSPSRGFSIELGAALVVLTGSRLEIPLSTTHCQVGATVGVGMAHGCSQVNWWLFLKVVAGWILTLVVASVLTAGVFSYAVYSPKA